MMNASRRLAVCGAAFSLLFCLSLASAQTPVSTPFSRALDKVDLGVSGIGLFNGTTSGTSGLPQAVNEAPSNTFGALVELRYTRSPLVGVELNYSYARFDENFTLNNTTGTPKTQFPYALTVQSKVNEYSIGYVGHGPEIFGVKPFAGAGVGGIEFKPTTGGGQGVLVQERFSLYYQVGLEQNFLSDHFGIRAQVRQVFFGAPDFNENYLATGARTSSFEPGVGFYLRF